MSRPARAPTPKGAPPRLLLGMGVLSSLFSKESSSLELGEELGWTYLWRFNRPLDRQTWPEIKGLC